MIIRTGKALKYFEGKNEELSFTYLGTLILLPKQRARMNFWLKTHSHGVKVEAYMRKFPLMFDVFSLIFLAFARCKSSLKERGSCAQKIVKIHKPGVFEVNHLKYYLIR